MNPSVCFVLGLVLPALALAQGGADAPRRDVEASMVVTGTITLNPNGSVQGYTLREPDKLPPIVLRIVEQAVPAWSFVPVIAGGKAVTAKAGMSLRIVADMLDAQHAVVRIAGAEFGCDASDAHKLLPNACSANTTVTPLQRTPPRYPAEALKSWVGGEVFLVLQIGRDGHVQRAVVRQVNLYSLTRDRTHYRHVLADATLRVARTWRYHIPTTGTEAEKDHWVVQVPVNYTIDGTYAATRKYGQWSVYVPGPVQHIPWDEDGRGTSRGSADAIASDASFVQDVRFVLKTSLSGSSGQS